MFNKNEKLKEEKEKNNELEKEWKNFLLDCGVDNLKIGEMEIKNNEITYDKIINFEQEELYVNDDLVITENTQNLDAKKIEGEEIPKYLTEEEFDAHKESIHKGSGTKGEIDRKEYQLENHHHKDDIEGLNIAENGHIHDEENPIKGTAKAEKAKRADYLLDENKERIEKDIYTMENSSDIPVGTIIWYHGTQAPDGFIICDGRTIGGEYHHHENYEKLYNALGGAGNRFTEKDNECCIPDLRGIFVRSYGSFEDDNRKINPDDRDEIFHQEDDIKRHRHKMIGPKSIKGSSGRWPSSNVHIGETTSRSNITSVGGDETRPRNVCLLPIIKYTSGGV